MDIAINIEPENLAIACYCFAPVAIAWIAAMVIVTRAALARLEKSP